LARIPEKRHSRMNFHFLCHHLQSKSYCYLLYGNLIGRNLHVSHQGCRHGRPGID